MYIIYNVVYSNVSEKCFCEIQGFKMRVLKTKVLWSKKGKQPLKYFILIRAYSIPNSAILSRLARIPKLNNTF